MMDPNINRQLQRLIRKNDLSLNTLKEIKPLMKQIDTIFNNYESDINQLETILELSNQELYKTNMVLRSDILAKSKAFKKVNKQLDFVINHAGVIIFQVDKYGRLVFLNQAWESITGFTIEESKNRHFKNFIHLLTKESLIRFNQFLNSDAENITDNFELKFPSHSQPKWIKLTMNYLHNSKKEYTGGIGIIVDISRLKAIEVKLRESEIKERRANNAKDDFLSIMSHEIRTPLNGVLGISHILLMNKHLPEQKEQLIALKYASEHLLNLVNNILDFSKIESGNIIINKSEFSLSELLDGLKINYLNKANEKGLSLIIKVSPSIPYILHGDLTRLHQILHNLLSNAFKFTNKGYVKLEVILDNRKGNMINVTFKISDSGKGISKDKLEIIFNKFTQEDSYIAKDYGGTGLGLTISKQLITLMNSQLKVKSVLGQGSTFWFTLPFILDTKINPLKNSESTITTLNNQWSDSSLKGITILVVDDNEINNLVISKIFIAWGINFVFATNGLEAIDLFNNTVYDLILMDLQMPELDGFETTTQIRALEPKGQYTPIIALSASAETSSITKAKQVGMDDFVRKPFKPTELFRTITKLINQYKKPIKENDQPIQ